MVRNPGNNFYFYSDESFRNQNDQRAALWIAFAVLCFLAIFEMCLVFDSSLVDELCTSTIDGLSILFLGLLSGSLVGADSKVPSRRMKLNQKSFIVIPLLFLIGRYFGYMIMNIMSAYSEKPIGTLLWTLGIGYWIAVMYWLLEETRKRSPMVQAVRFGVMIFGSYWLIYNFFCVAIPETLYMECFSCGLSLMCCL